MFKFRPNLNISETVRSFEWWDYKITLILGTVYATSLLFQVPLGSLLSFLFFLLAALVPGASYVSLLNDFTDAEEDKLAGKKNRLEGKSKAFALSMIFGCILVGWTVSFFLSGTTFILYGCAWIVFTLYSVPPIRLKKRGIFGVLADALGAHVFPQLFAVSALTDWFGREINLTWLCAVGVWSFFLGLRGILWHQLKDKTNDRIAGVRTFVQPYKETFVQNIVRWLVFPIEFSAFLFMLGYTRNRLAFVFLAFNIVMDLLRYFLWEVDIIIVGTSNRYRILMNEYYSVLYPLSFLIINLDFFLFSWIILILHIILFFRSLYEFCFELLRLIKHSLVALRAFVLNY